MFWAFRYALGRHTYAVADVSRYLIAHKDELGQRTRANIRREIKDHYDEYGNGGWQCDQDEWDAVVRAITDPT
jgi:hypothetical protein